MAYARRNLRSNDLDLDPEKLDYQLSEHWRAIAASDDSLRSRDSAQMGDERFRSHLEILPLSAAIRCNTIDARGSANRKEGRSEKFKQLQQTERF